MIRVIANEKYTKGTLFVYFSVFLLGKYKTISTFAA